MSSRSYPQRKSPRRQGYDYSRSGAYFITICIQEQRHLLGRVVDSRMHPNEAGQMVENAWQAIARKFPSVRLAEFVVMPNHIHGLLWLTTDLDVGLGGVEGVDAADDTKIPPLPALPHVMRWYKSWTTAQYRHGVVERSWTPFPQRLWHRSYYDYHVRRDGTLTTIRRYIRQNPQRWLLDRYHPEPEAYDPRAAEIWRLLKEEDAARKGRSPESEEE